MTVQQQKKYLQAPFHHLLQVQQSLTSTKIKNWNKYIWWCVRSVGRIENSEDPDQTAPQTAQGLHCLSTQFSLNYSLQGFFK